MRSIFIFVTLIFSLSGCQTGQKQQAEQAIVPVQTEDELSNELSQALEKKYGLSKDVEVESALAEIARRLSAGDPISVKVLNTKELLMAPGLKKRIFLSKGLLSLPKYENEAAFLLAIQIVFIRAEQPRKRLAELRGEQLGEGLIDSLPTTPRGQKANFDPIQERWFETGGLFFFGTPAMLEASRAAVRLIHSAHFDPRGAVTLIERAPVFPKNENQEFLRVVRDEIAKLSPLRDPIVRGESFDLVHRRLSGGKRKKN